MPASSFQQEPDGSPLSENDRRALTRFLEQSLDHGFRLAIVEAANFADREAILNDVAGAIGDGVLRVAVDDLPGADSNLWASLQEPFAAWKYRCLALWGFENLARSDWARQLNVQRDLFVRDFAVPWLLFIHPASRVRLMQEAPDFCDFAILWVRDEVPTRAVTPVGTIVQDNLLSAGPVGDNPLLQRARAALDAGLFDAARDALAQFELQPDQSVLDRVRCQLLAARLERHSGHFAAAEAVIRDARNVLARQPPSADVSALARLTDSEFGLILYKSGRYAEAEEQLRRTLKAVEEAVGREHPHYGACLNNLAGVLGSQGKKREAEHLFEEAARIATTTLGPDHPSRAASLEGLASSLFARGRHGEAERLLREALDITGRAQGREHPAYAAGLHNLAAMLLSQGRDAEAERAFREALAIKERVLGHEHPDYGLSLKGLAGVMARQGKYTEAESMLRALVRLFEKAVGREHRDYGECLLNLADVQAQAGKYAEAEDSLRHSVSVLERVLGREHPDYGPALHGFGDVLSRQGKYAEAEPVLRRSLALREKVYGAGHVELFPGLVLLATVVASQGRLLEGIRLLERALSIGQPILGDDDPEIRHVRHVLKDFQRRRRRR